MYLNTARVPWVSLREAGDDTIKTVFTYLDWPNSGVLNKIKTSGETIDINAVLISMFGTDAADEDILYNLYGRMRQNGPIILLATGIATLGTRIATEHPITGVTITNGKWVDSITVTGGAYQDLIDVLDFGTNRVCMLKFDLGPIEDLWMEMDLDGGNTTAASMYAMLTGY